MIIPELEVFCKDFILHNKVSVSGVPDVFLFLSMNSKVVCKCSNHGFLESYILSVATTT